MGFVVGDIRENAPIFKPDHVGHVSVLVVTGNMRRSGVGDSLWKALHSWFASRGVTYCELYTEFENCVSGPFWSGREFKRTGLTICSVHPGRLKTDSASADADKLPDEAAAVMVGMLSSLKHGRFYDLFEGTIAW